MSEYTDIARGDGRGEEIVSFTVKFDGMIIEMTEIKILKSSRDEPGHRAACFSIINVNGVVERKHLGLANE